MNSSISETLALSKSQYLRVTEEFIAFLAPTSQEIENTLKHLIDGARFEILRQDILSSVLPREATLYKIYFAKALLDGSVTSTNPIDPESDEFYSLNLAADMLIDALASELGLAAFAKSGNAKHAANARHSRNREIKEKARNWYRRNYKQFRTADQAAIALMEVVPREFSTVRRWITDFRQEISAK